MRSLAVAVIVVAFVACSRPDAPGAGSGNASSSASSSRATRPDVLLVSIDSLRADHVSCYGYAKPTTPNIDRIAREGVRCAQAVSTTSWTLPAHAALFTGLYDTTHGVVDNGLALSPRATTLAELLHDAGYATAGFYGGPYLHPVFGLSQGFDRWESCMASALTRKREDLVKDVLDARETSSLADVTSPRTLEAVTRYLATAPKETPLFVFVHLWDVHYDYRPPEAYWRRFDPDYAGKLDARDLPHNPALHAAMPPRELEHLVALYDGEIAFTDEHLGRILDAWEARRGKDGIVLVVSDHGEEFFEHGGKGHQRALFEESIRVPFVVRWPGRFDGGRTVNQLVRLVDVAPTIAAAAGVAQRTAVQGRDLAPLLAGGELDPAPALCELLVDGGETRALRREATKIVRYKDGRLRFAFDVVRDPKEEAPLADDSTSMRLGLADLETAVDAARALAKKLRLSPRRIVPEKAIESALNGLGYGGEDDEKPR